MYHTLLLLGITVAVMLIFILVMALALRNRPSGHCGLCGQQKKFGCFRGNCPEKVWQKRAKSLQPQTQENKPE